MQLSGIDLNQLVVLQALLETESVKDAARRVALSPSAVSHSLARLREQLGDPLLVRAGQRLVLTPFAQQVRPRLTAALEALDRAVAHEAPFDPATAERRFTVACTDHVELSVLRVLGQRLLVEAPRVDLHSVAPRGDSTERLRRGEVDLGIGVFRGEPDDVVTEVLYRERFVTLMRPGHRARRGRWTPERFAALDHVLVAPGGIPRGIVDERLESLGLERRIARVVATFQAAPWLLLESDLVVTLPSGVAAVLAPALGLAQRAPPLDDLEFDVRMLWHRRDENEPAHRWLREVVRKTARAL